MSRYAKSKAMLERASRVIPLGSQTFSKSYLNYPRDAAPLFLERGRGSHVWDVDGNEYIDFVNGLLPVILGYCDPDVTAAVTQQMEHGVIFSLATPLEVEAAELLVQLIPCAEMVRFGKNGSDATTGAIRVARAYTGRDLVAVCGYHGWHDWYIGSTARNKGIPPAVAGLTRQFKYNDLDSLRTLLHADRDRYAAVVMEPMNFVDPAPGFLEGVRELTHAHGALFVLDEIITGFRFHLGGAQALFDVTPDLAAFGKSMGNGFPISAVVGREKYMREMEEVFFSSTFGGDAVGLAASVATIRKMQREPVIEHLWRVGALVSGNTRAGIAQHGLGGAVALGGKPPWSMLQFRDTPRATQWEVKSLYLQEMLKRGILTAGAHNMSYSHSEADVGQLAEAQEAAFATIAAALDAGDVRARLAGPPIEPIFKVR